MAWPTNDATAREAPTREAPPDAHLLPANSMIGPYRVDHVLGEGGFGIVYRAQQEEPVRRQVAIKVIKRGMETPQVVARFERERDALARLDHPGVCRVWDAGVTACGRPYFVMDYVDGAPITEYCDRRRLGIAARLELFVAVCDTVGYAHGQDIVHRDIKPQNILIAEIDGLPQPKVIDFGVAKGLVERPLAKDDPPTVDGQLLGTPEYMSPEQAAGGAGGVDELTDVYSLGVVLYELLVGALPLDLCARPLDEARLVVRYQEPLRPSVRVRALGDETDRVTMARSAELHALSRRLRGDLDWIAMRALEKDPARRYDSAIALERDIDRHLRRLPIQARSPGRLRRVRKFASRHRGAMAAFLVIVGTLAAGAFGTTLAMLRARTAEAQAEREAARTRDALTFLECALEHFELAVTRRVREHGTTDRETMAARFKLARALVALGRTDDARRHLEGLLADQRRVLGEQHLDTTATAGALRQLEERE